MNDHRLEVRITKEQYDHLWKLHSKHRKSVGEIIRTMIDIDKMEDESVMDLKGKNG